MESAGEEVQEREPTDRIGERVENLRRAGMKGVSLVAGFDGEVWAEAVVVMILRIGFSSLGSCSCSGSAGAGAGSGTFLYSV
jgi:hypothetical protein